MGNFVITGATDEGSALIDSGAFHEVTEVDVLLTSPGLYVNFVSSVSPRRVSKAGWIGLSLATAFPGTTTPIYQWLTMQQWIDHEYRIMFEPAPNSSGFAWGADTIMWHVGDSVVDINVWFL